MDANICLTVQHQRETLIVTLLREHGSLAGHDLEDQWERLLDMVAEPQVHNVVLDLSEVDYFGSNVLEYIVLIAKQLKSRGGKLALCNPSTIVREIILLARFDKLFPIVESRSAALHAVGAE